jgi:hypothetical protein
LLCPAREFPAFPGFDAAGSERWTVPSHYPMISGDAFDYELTVARDRLQVDKRLGFWSCFTFDGSDWS